MNTWSVSSFHYYKQWCHEHSLEEILIEKRKKTGKKKGGGEKQIQMH